jgi:serine/threonine-protein kinase
VVKILDLGLVRSQADVATGLTRRLDSRTILGTADYVAPEQAVDSSAVDIRADLYSLGATLYFLLTGRPLFPDGRTAQKLVWQQIKDPVPVSRFRPEVPPGLADVVHTLLQKRPADRYQTPAEAFEALAPWDDVEVPPPAEEWLPRLPARVLALRGAVPAAGAARASGSTSQILTLAMRSGSGPVKRPGGGGGDPSSGTSAIGTGSGMRRAPADPSAETDAVRVEDTHRTPHVPRPPRPVDPDRRRVPLLALVTVCAAAAAAAATAAVIVAMR